MAPIIPRDMSHINIIYKRDHEAQTWYIIGAALGVFALAFGVGLWVTCSRRSLHKRQQVNKKRASQVAAKGAYVKLEDKSMKASFEEELRPIASRSGGGKQDQVKGLVVETPDSQNRSASAGPATIPYPTHDFLVTTPSGTKHQEVYLPPPVASQPDSRRSSLSSSMDESFERSRGRDRTYNYDRSRSNSAAASILERNASMLQPRATSPHYQV